MGCLSLGLAVIVEVAGLAMGLCALDILRQLKKRVASLAFVFKSSPSKVVRDVASRGLNIIRFI